jgi:ribosomal protein L21E
MLVFLTACKKDSDSHQAPVTEPLSAVAVKAGDTIRIKGANFSTDVNQNKVSFNGVAGTVVSATENELVVVVPEGATTGKVTVTVYENTVEAGILTINKFTLYSIRKTSIAAGKYNYELVAIDPATSAVTTILSLPDGVTIGNLVYLPATNEVVGIDHSQSRLVKINPATKQTTTFMLSNQLDKHFEDLTLDKDGNLYTIGTVGLASNAVSSITKIDPATGNITPLASFKSDIIEFAFVSATNELVGISGKQLVKFNLTTRDTSSLVLNTTGNPSRSTMATDNNSNLYCIKVYYSGNSNTQIVKLDAATGAETVITTLTEVEPINNLSFVTQRNELVAIWNGTSIYRYNIGNNTSTLTEITSAASVNFSNLIAN